MTAEPSLEKASHQHIEALHRLINQAYRGAEGWTRETHIVSGERISRDAVQSLVESDTSHLFITRNKGEISACICVEAQHNSAYIGTFAVAPAYQNQGLGRHVLDQAERFARDILGADTLNMVVISQRPELIAYYERRGYQRTGETENYPLDMNVGTPVIDGLSIEVLKKSV